MKSNWFRSVLVAAESRMLLIGFVHTAESQFDHNPVDFNILILQLDRNASFTWSNKYKVFHELQHTCQIRLLDYCN